jgi:hypothetical protein
MIGSVIAFPFRVAWAVIRGYASLPLWLHYVLSPLYVFGLLMIGKKLL